MKRLTILVDADDVIDDLLPAWLAVLNRMSGQSLEPEDITDWNIQKFYPTLPADTVYAVPSGPEFWDLVGAVPGAEDGLKALLDAGHQVRIVTASHYSTLHLKIPRLLQLFPFLSWDNFIVTDNKTLVRGDIMVDDNLRNLRDPSKFNILFDRPHNRALREEENGVVRAHDWNDVLFAVRCYRTYTQCRYWADVI